MIEERAKVVKLQDNLAIIEMQRQSGCQSCSLSGGCGVGSLGRLLGQRNQVYSIPNQQDLQPGESIIIGIPNGSFLLASLLMYLLPLISLFLFGLVAQLIFHSNDVVTALLSLVGLALGLFLTLRLTSMDFARNFQPRFMRRERDVLFHPESSISLH